MRFLALSFVLALSVACGPALEVRPHGPLCEPKISTLLYGDHDASLHWYAEAVATLENEFDLERPAMCDVTVAVWPLSSYEAVESACSSVDAAACVNVDPDDGFYLIRFLETRPDHLRHEWLHVLFSELGIPEPKHHPAMNRANVYYYPHGRNLNVR